MLLGGKTLLKSQYKKYPADLPILFIHGTVDKVTSFEATKELFEKLNAKDKKLEAHEGFYHEAHNEPGDDKVRVINNMMDWADSHVATTTA